LEDKSVRTSYQKRSHHKIKPLSHDIDNHWKKH
jgi:hypothetical protein